MRLIKYEHACFAVEKDTETIIVDPGVFTNDLELPLRVSAVVLTHEHADHLHVQRLEDIVSANPEVVIFCHISVADQLGSLPTQSINAGDKKKVGNFSLEFFGGNHALIHDSIPVIPNLGVLIDDTIYYPGDSFARPDAHVDILAIPAAAPWMKISEAIDFIHTVTPRIVFPTHDAILSDDGKALVDRLLGAAAQKIGVEYRRLDAPLEI